MMRLNLVYLGFIFCFKTWYASAQSHTWREDFNNNKRTWWTGINEFYEIKIQDGYYELNYFKKPTPEINVLIVRDQLSLIKDWDIESRIKIIKLEGEQNSFGLAIGEQDRGNSHYYVLSPNLKRTWWYEFRMFKQNVLKIEPLPINIFDQDDTLTGTKICIKHRGGTLYFYVNDILMNTVHAPKTWHGNGIGLFANNASILRMDYLEIKQY